MRDIQIITHILGVEKYKVGDGVESHFFFCITLNFSVLRSIGDVVSYFLLKTLDAYVRVCIYIRVFAVNFASTSPVGCKLLNISQ